MSIGGQGFYASHQDYYPDLERPPRTVNIGWLGVQLMMSGGGSCFLPRRMAWPLIKAGRLFEIKEAPEIPHPAYMVFPRDASSKELVKAIEGLREQAQQNDGEE
jgi:DNA-binding transcriptional LysR family regulator